MKTTGVKWCWAFGLCVPGNFEGRIFRTGTASWKRRS
jgi:hypothetical protein